MNKFLKILIFILVALLVLAILAMVIAPAQLKLEESETMEAPPNMIYNMVNDFKTWESWSPWQKMDPNAVNTYSEKTSGVGATWSWKGDPKSVGEGTQKIVESIKGEKIRTSLEFGGFDGLAYSDWNFANDGDKTKVTWTFEGAQTPFYLRPFNLLMKGSLKKTYKEGLANLEKIIDERVKEKKYRGYTIKEVEMPEKHYVMRRSMVDMNGIQQFYSESLAQLFSGIQGSNIELDGKPTGLFFKWIEEEGTTDMATSLPVKKDVSVKGFSSFTIPAGKAIKIDHYGDFSKTHEAHYAIDEYIKDYGLISNSPMVEEYVGNDQNSDQAKSLTRIIYYLAED